MSSKLFRRRALILLGPRQVGKTTLVGSMLESGDAKYIEFNGDEPDVRSLLDSPTSSRLRKLTAGNSIVFIDEAQRIPNIGLTLKLIVDHIPEVQVIASGSSSLDLAEGTFEALTGRKYEFYLYPLSWSELAAHNEVLEEHRNLEHRLIYGGYPEIVCSPGEEEELLKEISGSYLYKDLLSLEQLRKPAVLEKLLTALALQVGNEVSYNELAEIVGSDNQTVQRYIDLLEKTFVIFRLPAFSRNVRNEIKKGRKMYFYDNGIRNAILGNFTGLHQRSDIGALWENYLLSERQKIIAYSNAAVQSYFWRTTLQQEIDYVEEREGALDAYEFKWNPRKAGHKLPTTFTRAYSPSSTAVITRENYQGFLENI
jgi:hypothetical protein